MSTRASVSRETAERLATALLACSDSLAELLDDLYDLRQTNPRQLASWMVAMQPVNEARAALQQWLEQAA